MIGDEKFLTVKFEFLNFRAPHLPLPVAAYSVFNDEDSNRDVVLVYHKPEEWKEAA